MRQRLRSVGIGSAAHVLHLGLRPQHQIALLCERRVHCFLNFSSQIICFRCLHRFLLRLPVIGTVQGLIARHEGILRKSV